MYYASFYGLRGEGRGGGQVDFDGDTYGTPTQEIIKKKTLTSEGHTVNLLIRSKHEPQWSNSPTTLNKL